MLDILLFKDYGGTIHPNGRGQYRRTHPTPPLYATTHEAYVHFHVLEGPGHGPLKRVKGVLRP